MLSVDTKTLFELLSKASKGGFGTSKASEIQESDTDTFGVNFAKNALAFQIKQIIAQINFIEKQLKELEAEISTLLHRFNQVITTITGIGDALCAIIIGEIGDISCFESAPQLVAYAGLDVSVKQSGDFVGTHTKISNRRSPFLRRAIWLAATVVAFKDPALSRYYQPLKARGKHHLTAVGAVARKMTNIILQFFGITNLICLILTNYTIN